MTNKEKKFRLSLIIQKEKELIIVCLKIWVTLGVTTRIT